MHVAPYVSEQKKKKKRRQKYFLIAAGVVILYGVCTAVWWFIFRSPVFRLDAIVVQGNSQVASSDIITLFQSNMASEHGFLGSFLGQNNILAWPDTISTSEMNLLPQLATASVSKDYFSHTLTINVTERNPFGIWCFLNGTDQPTSGGDASNNSADATDGSSTVQSPDGDCYWFDNTGVLFEKAANTQGNLIFVVDDYSQSPRGLSQKVLPDEFTGNFISIMNVLHQTNLPVKDIELRDLSLDEVHAVLLNGPTIYFSLRFPANDYLAVIQSIASQPGFANLQYIDCRTEDRVYYK